MIPISASRTGWINAKPYTNRAGRTVDAKLLAVLAANSMKIEKLHQTIHEFVDPRDEGKVLLVKCLEDFPDTKIRA